MQARRWPNASRPSRTAAAAPSSAKDYDRAIADYGEAIKLSPKDAWAFAHRCEAYAGKEDHNAAIADCTEAIRIDPKYGFAYNNRGIAYYGLHDYDAALADHDEAIAINAKDAWAHVRHGMAWTEKGEFERAIADINEALTIDPKYAFAFGQRGQAQFRKRLITKKGGWEPAIEDFGEAIKLDPNLLWLYSSRALPTATSPIQPCGYGLRRGHQARTKKFHRLQLPRRRLRRPEGLWPRRRRLPRVDRSLSKERRGVLEIAAMPAWRCASPTTRYRTMTRQSR